MGQTPTLSVASSASASAAAEARHCVAVTRFRRNGLPWRTSRIWWSVYVVSDASLKFFSGKLVKSQVSCRTRYRGNHAENAIAWWSVRLDLNVCWSLFLVFPVCWSLFLVQAGGRPIFFPACSRSSGEGTDYAMSYCGGLPLWYWSCQ